MSGAPDPKSRSLARGERRYRRKVASPKQWQAIIAAKGRTCRLSRSALKPCDGQITYHHIVSREDHGDDVAANIVPVCELHHEMLTRLSWPARNVLARRLSDAEYAYVVGKLGEAGPERLFGVGRS